MGTKIVTNRPPLAGDDIRVAYQLSGGAILGLPGVQIEHTEGAVRSPKREIETLELSRRDGANAPFIQTSRRQVDSQP